MVEDADFLAWYERCLDEAVAGYDVGWFGERLPLDGPELVAALTGDPSPQRRARAGESLLQLPVVSDRAWTAVADAVVADGDPAVRAWLWHVLRWQTRDRRRRLDNPNALADAIAQDARSQSPPDLEALATLRRLVFADVAPELSSDNLERRRRAAYHLAWERWEIMAEGIGQSILEQVAHMLLDDADPLVRSDGVAIVHWYGLAGLHPRLRELQKTETDHRVQERLRWCLFRRPAVQGADSAVADGSDVPPF